MFVRCMPIKVCWKYKRWGFMSKLELAENKVSATGRVSVGPRADSGMRRACTRAAPQVEWKLGGRSGWEVKGHMAGET